MLSQIFVSVLNMSFTGGFIILLVLVARLFLKKSPKIFSYGLWSVVLFRLLCPFSFESILSLLPTNISPIPTNIGLMAKPQVETGISVINTAVNNLLPIGTPYSSVNPLQVWIFIGSIIWLVGIGILLIYSLVSFLKLKNLLKTARCFEQNVFISDQISTAFVMGIIPCKIYLPHNLNNAEIEYILLHEQTHIRRMDHIIRVVAYLSLCIHWFNPLVWVAYYYSNQDMELSCDETVIAKLGSKIKKDYSSCLLNLATGKSPLGFGPLAFGEGDTKSRIIFQSKNWKHLSTK